MLLGQHHQRPDRDFTWIFFFFYVDKTCLIVVDALSKYIEVKIVKNVSVQETIDALRVIFSRHGLPDVICFSHGIDHVASPHHLILPLHTGRRNEVLEP